MRKVVLAVCLTVAAVGLAAQAGAQTTRSFSATFKGHTPKPKAAGCPGVCGTGTLQGFGEALFTFIPVAEAGGPGSCREGQAILIARLGDGSALVFDFTGAACFPGNSHDAPGGFHSYGNPFRATGTLTVTDGSGVFAGATGSGTGSVRAAGAHISGSISGTLILPSPRGPGAAGPPVTQPPNFS